jgi:hypothetical protein
MQPYKQTTGFTCAAASLSMIIHHFKPDFLLNVENEFDIWQKTVTLPTRGCSIWGLAIYAFDKGIPLRIVVGDATYKFPGYKFKSYKKKDVDVANFFAQLLYLQVKKRGIKVEEHAFGIEDVKKELIDGKILLLRLVSGILRGSKRNKRNSHYFAIFGYKAGKFMVLDPKKGQILVEEEALKNSFEKVIEVQRDNRMIVFG